MKPQLLELLCCPHCRGDLALGRAYGGGEEIEQGELICSPCDRRYPIIHSVPRFVAGDHYTSNFGWQWNRFRRTQLDSYTGLAISGQRFFRETGWSAEQLDGKIALDVGCGAGRFAEIALSCGAHVVAVDLSLAVDVCWSNLGPHPRLDVVQADVYALPLRQDHFDFVYCLGVLQHTPNPRAAFLSLPTLLKPGGRLAVDVYPKRWYTFFYPKYWMRPITTLLPRTVLFQAVERAVPVLLPLSRAVGRLPTIGLVLRRLIPVANYEGIYPLTEQQLQEWAMLDTFDWLSPAYDLPQTANALRSWLEQARLKEIEVVKIGHLVGRGRK